MHEIGMCEIQDIDMVIQLANRDTISPVGIVRDVEVLCDKTKYLADFLVLGSVADNSCPVIFGRPFLITDTHQYRGSLKSSMCKYSINPTRSRRYKYLSSQIRVSLLLLSMH